MSSEHRIWDGRPPDAATVYGLCPACKAWQVEVAIDVAPVAEIVALVTEAVEEHDAADHPGRLRTLARTTRLRAAADRVGWPPANGVDVAARIVEYLDAHPGAWDAFHAVRYGPDGEAARLRLYRSIDLWTDRWLSARLPERNVGDAFALLLGVAAGYHLDRDLTGEGLGGSAV